MIGVYIVVSGRVQGVGFRSGAQRRASQLGLSGWLRNLPDGSVEILAEGREDLIEEFLDWCRRGPSGAVVDDVSVERRGAEGLRGFVRR